MIQNIKQAFTLVELMIVVVILSIVATIGFISYEDYIIDARDSKRLAQLTGLRDSMRLAVTKGSLPLPDSDVEIRNNGQTFMYQGYAGKDVLNAISFSENTYDPADEQFYTYLVSSNRKDFQLLGFLEKYNPDVVSLNRSQVFAEDYSQRFPRTVGKKLGILLQQQTNTPIQELSPYTSSGYFDLATDTSNKLFDAYITDTYLISGSGSSLTWIIPFTTCKKILENGDSYGDGYYSINPTWTDPFEVYCNMTIDGGGWTLIARWIPWGTGNFWWLVSNGEVRNDSYIYSFWDKVKSLNFSEIMLTTYSTEKNIDRAVKVIIDKNYLSNEVNYQYIRWASSCEEVFPINTSWRSACDTDGVDGKVWGRNFVQTWGWMKDGWWIPINTYFFFRQWTAPFSSNSVTAPSGALWLYPNMYTWDAAWTSSSLWEFEGRAGMIFVR